MGQANARKRKKLLRRPKGVSNPTKYKYHYAKHLYGNMDVPIMEAWIKTKINKISFFRVENELLK